MHNCKGIQGSIDYIEEHLADEISLDNLAAIAFFSKYHFHRLFKTGTGKTLMEYVRERRLTQATHELVYSSMTVTHIAYSLNFNSHDAFDKAFKRAYGVSPSEYRKNNVLKFTDITSKEGLKLNDFNLLNKTSCSIEDKRECLKVLDIIISLSKKSHKQGLLSLESEINERLPFLLQKGLELLLYGTEPLVLREILDNYIYAGNYNGKELLSRVLTRNGVLAMQMGEYPWVIRETLASFFGEDFSNEIKQHFGNNDEDKDAKIAGLISAIENQKPYSEATNLLENVFEKLDKRSIQRVLREVDITDLAIGMKGAKGVTQCRIIEGLPRSSVLILIELNDLIEGIGVAQIVDAQNRMIGQIKKLKAEGEIM
jgi:AraC-like DNA-binding protein